MNWRQWVHATLIGNTAFANLVPPTRIHGAASLTARPAAAPFVVVQFQPSTPAVKDGVAYRLGFQVWAHDEPGSYVAIDAILGAAATALVGTVALPGAVRVDWQGNSQDLADDGLSTVTKFASFVAIGTGRG